MRIVKIKGGLGNQLFQYAFALFLKKRTNEVIKLDYSSCYGTRDVTCFDYVKLFNLSLEEASRDEIKKECLFFNKYPLMTLRYRFFSLLSWFFDNNYYYEKSRLYLDFQSIASYRYYDGYWQSFLYSQEIEKQLMTDLVPKNRLSEKTQSTIKKIDSENAVFIGIRKGDYSKTNSNKKRFGSFSIDYYLNAIKTISKFVQNPVFYVFSNDVDWCKKNINWSGNIVYYREKEDQFSDFEELIIMSKCKHAIILNSTFHWWGAFLIRNKEKIIIAPADWFADGTREDIIPPSWIRMKRNGEIEE